MTVTIEKCECQICKEITFQAVVEKKDVFIVKVCEKCKTVQGKGMSSQLVLRIT